MIDVQNLKDNRNINIDKVGITNLTYQISILSKYFNENIYYTKLNMYVSLQKDYKGTHMSRFIEILEEADRKINLDYPEIILSKMKKNLNSDNAFLEMKFPFFIEKESPISKKKSFMNYIISFKSSLSKENILKKKFKLSIPITTLCPCSKKISQYGAHNQRGKIILTLIPKKELNIKKYILDMEAFASSPVYSIIKREDEKYVTEKAYDNPQFVEDIVREIYIFISKDSNISFFRIECENFESIHNHNAYASIRSKKF